MWLLITDKHDMCLCLYRVAQNKIPHWRICNISATGGLILKKFLKLLNPDTSLNLTVYNISTAS